MFSSTWSENYAVALTEKVGTERLDLIVSCTSFIDTYGVAQG